MVSFSDLLSTKTLDDWKRSIVNVATLVGLKTENWAEGGYTRTLVALFAQLYKTAGDVIRLIAASGFLDTADGDWLTLLAKSVFNVERIEATFAKAPLALTLTNGGGGLFTFEERDIVVAHSSSGKTYRNTTGGALSPGIGQTLTLDLEAEEAGTDSNAAIGSITILITTFLGVTCSNVVALAGLDEESDPDLRQRCRDSLAILSLGGIKAAYAYFARSAVRPDGSAIGVTRVKVIPPPGDGTLDVYIATASGEVAMDDVAIVQDVFDESVTPYGFDATAISATNKSITAPCEIWIPSSLGLTEAAARAVVLAALESYVETLPIGGVVISPATGQVYWRALLGIVESSIPGMLKAELDAETDTAIATGEVPVWGGVLSDTTVTQVVP